MIQFKAGKTLLILAAIALLGLGYMTFSVLDMGFTKKTTHVKLMLTRSGGLLPTSPVTMRGINVGRVTHVQITESGLDVTLELDGDHPVPVDSAIAIKALSMAGEQYVDFSPRQIEAPYWSDGAVIPASRVTPSVTVNDALSRSNALFAALDPKDVSTILTTITDTLVGNDAAMETLMTSGELFAKMIEDNKRIIATLFSNMAPLTDKLEGLNGTSLLAELSKRVPGAILANSRIAGSLKGVADLGSEGDFKPDAALPTLVGKLGEYLDDLAGPLGTFAPILEDATSPVRDVQIDAGSWLDFYNSTFDPATGAMRVRVNTAN